MSGSSLVLPSIAVAKPVTKSGVSDNVKRAPEETEARRREEAVRGASEKGTAAGAVSSVITRAAGEAAAKTPSNSEGHLQIARPSVELTAEGSLSADLFTQLVTERLPNNKASLVGPFDAIKDKFTGRNYSPANGKATFELLTPNNQMLRARNEAKFSEFANLLSPEALAKLVDKDPAYRDAVAELFNFHARDGGVEGVSALADMLNTRDYSVQELGTLFELQSNALIGGMEAFRAANKTKMEAADVAVVNKQLSVLKLHLKALDPSSAEYKNLDSQLTIAQSSLNILSGAVKGDAKLARQNLKKAIHESSIVDYLNGTNRLSAQEIEYLRIKCLGGAAA